MRKYSRAAVVFIAAALLCIGGAVAWAAWTSHGAGTAKATAGHSVPLVVLAVTVSPNTPLYPGGDGDLVVKVRNDNSYPVTVISLIKTSGTITADGPHAASGCAGAAVGVTMPDPVVLVDWVLQPGETGTFQEAGVVHMDNSAANGCQGAKFNIPIALTATSS